MLFRSAEERRIAREKALEWTREVKRMESDEEREKAAKKAKRGKRIEHVSGDEGVEGEPKPKKRRGKLKKSADSGAENEDEALFSGEDEEQKPKKVGTFRCLLAYSRLDAQCANINNAQRSAPCKSKKQ